MANSISKDWEKDSEKLFIHESGVRIQRMTYKGKDGWYLVPIDLDEAVIEFEPTPEGRDKAFEAFEKGSLATKPKKAKPASKKAPAKAAKPAEDGEAAEDKDEDDDEEKEEKEDDGEDA
jgi:DNA replication initiation complex subunit (GINS family)